MWQYLYLVYLNIYTNYILVTSEIEIWKSKIILFLSLVSFQIMIRSNLKIPDVIKTKNRSNKFVHNGNWIKMVCFGRELHFLSLSLFFSNRSNYTLRCSLINIYHFSCHTSVYWRIILIYNLSDECVVSIFILSRSLL